MRKSLGQSFDLLVLWVIIFALVAGSIWATSQAQSDAQAIMRSSVLGNASTIASQVEVEFEHIEDLLRITEMRYVKSPNAAAREQLRQDIGQELVSSSLPFRIGISDAEGRVIWDSSRNWNPDKDIVSIASRRYFERAYAGELSLVHDGPFPSLLDGQPIITLSRAVQDKRGKFQGVIFAVLPSASLGPHLLTLNLGEGTVLDLRTAEMAPVVRVPKLTEQQTEVESRFFKQARALLHANSDKGQVSFSSEAIESDDSLLYGAVKLKSIPYWMVVGIRASTGRHLWLHSVQVLWGLCLLACFLLIVSFRAHRQNRERLQSEVVKRDKELDRTENFLTTMAQNIPGLVSHWTGDLICDYASARHADFFGLTPSEILGLSLQMLMGKKRFTEITPNVKDALEGRESALEIWTKDTEGNDRCLLVRFIPDANASNPALFLFSIDITEAQLATADLQRSLNRIQELYDQAPCGYHSLNAKGVFTSINDTELQWLGYSREEVVGKMTLESLLTPDQVNMARAEFEEFKKNGFVKEMPLSFKRKNGELLHVVVNATAVYDDYGNYSHSRSVVLDIGKIIEEQNNLNHVLSAAPTAVRVASLEDNRVLFMNEAFLTLVKRTREQAYKMDISKNYVDPKVFSEICNDLAQGRSVRNRLIQLHIPERPDVPNVWAAASYMIIRYNGKPAVLAWLFDVTELQDAKFAAESASHAKSRFLEAVSHEIRTPLHQIRGTAIALESEIQSPIQLEQLSVIKQQSRVLLGMIEDVLAYSQLDSGQGTLSRDIISIASLCNLTHLAFGQTCQDKSLGFQVEDQSELEENPTLIGDQQKIELVINNLVSNAIKFTPSGQIGVLFKLTPIDSETVNFQIRVTDTGIGLSAELRETLFQPFVQGHSFPGRQFGGTGLGLALLQRNVQLMGGTVGVWSIPGNGSTFWVDLPLQVAAAADS